MTGLRLLSNWLIGSSVFCFWIIPVYPMRVNISTFDLKTLRSFLKRKHFLSREIFQRIISVQLNALIWGICIQQNTHPVCWKKGNPFLRLRWLVPGTVGDHRVNLGELVKLEALRFERAELGADARAERRVAALARCCFWSRSGVGRIGRRRTGRGPKRRYWLIDVDTENTNVRWLSNDRRGFF